MENSDIQLLASQNQKQPNQVQESGSVIQHRVFVEFDQNSRLPTKLTTLDALCQIVKDVFGASLDDQCRRVIAQNQIDMGGITVDEFDSQVPFSIMFVNGIYKSDSKSNPISIKSIVIKQNSIVTIVNGNSADAKDVIIAAYNAVLKKAGYSNKFSENCVHARAHTCLTTARLNFGISSVFSEAISDIIGATMKSDAERFKNIGAMRVDTTEAQLKNYIVVPKIESVEFSITRIDTSSGASEVCQLRISPNTKTDVDMGDYVFLSEYPEEVHNELVKAFTEALSS